MLGMKVDLEQLEGLNFAKLCVANAQLFFCHGWSLFVGKDV